MGKEDYFGNDNWWETDWGALERSRPAPDEQVAQDPAAASEVLTALPPDLQPDLDDRQYSRALYREEGER